MDTYIAECTRQPTNFTGNADDSTGYVAGVILPPPPDAGRCIPCKSCTSGSYTSRRCDGKGLVDDRTCAPCTSKCLAGTYMHAPCDGKGFDINGNDCRYELNTSC